MRKKFIFFVLVVVALVSCTRKSYFFEKTLEFPSFVNDEQKIELSAYLIPTQQQLEWQELELTAFVHFGMNTFTGKEWGDGTDNPSLFNPTDFDAEQWVKLLKESGFKMIILTAKHHDGFCLWPTKTTQYSVASSPWRNGQGDIVQEVKNACDKYGLNFGVYLSPWDRNAPIYGNTKEYNNFFISQLKELLTNYGEIKEVWFDGANGETETGKIQKYDWASYYHVIDSLQPKAVKAIMGNDIRWVGNEKGLGRETEWSVTPLNPEINDEIVSENRSLGISPTSKDLGSRQLIARSKKLYWYPSEVDVSIRPGWFYHPEQDHQVKSLAELVDIYYKSVGMNSVLLLNIPPDTRGRIHEIDSQRLKEFSNYIQRVFSENKIINNNPQKWVAKPTESKEFNLNKNNLINTILLQEDIKEGQRVEAFRVDGFLNGAWAKLSEGTTIGHKRILKIKNTNPTKIRVTILATRAPANIKNVGAYFAPALVNNSPNNRKNILKKDAWKVKKENPIIVDMGDNINFAGFSYKPDSLKESVYKYNFKVSENGNSWKTIKTGEFGNIKNNPLPQTVYFEKPQQARFFQIETLKGANGGKPSVSLQQIEILLN